MTQSGAIFFNQSCSVKTAVTRVSRPLHPLHVFLRLVTASSFILSNFCNFNLSFVTVCVILLALVPFGKFETATNEESDSQSHCSAEGKCSLEKEGEFGCGMC